MFTQKYKWKKDFLGKSSGSRTDFTKSLANYIKKNNLSVKNGKTTGYVKIDKYISDITGLKENNLIRYLILYKFLIPIIFGGPLKKGLYDIDGVYKIKVQSKVYIGGSWSTQERLV